MCIMMCAVMQAHKSNTLILHDSFVTAKVTENYMLYHIYIIVYKYLDNQLICLFASPAPSICFFLFRATFHVNGCFSLKRTFLNKRPLFKDAIKYPPPRIAFKPQNCLPCLRFEVAKCPLILPYPQYAVCISKSSRYLMELAQTNTSRARSCEHVFGVTLGDLGV